MIRILLQGADDIACKYIQLLMNQADVKIVAVIHEDLNAPGILLAEKFNIPTAKSFNSSIHVNVNYIVIPSADGYLFKQLENKKSVTRLVQENENIIFNDFIQHSNLEVILQNIDDGLVVIDDKATIQFINDQACLILEVSKSNALGKNIKEIIDNSGLLRTLQTRQREINKRINLKNGRHIITSRVPIINQDNHLTGAFAFFKEASDIQEIAEANTDLNSIRTALTTLFTLSKDAICLVDENGYIINVNRAYTRLMHTSKARVIGKHLSEHELVCNKLQLQVLATRRPVQNETMNYAEKLVNINIEPIIVSGRLKGSIAVIEDLTQLSALDNELCFTKQIIRNLERNYLFDDIIHQSSIMSLVIQQAKIASNSIEPVLLKGEIGTGKELFAKAIHNESELRYNKFIQVNCASLLAEDVELQLFGREHKDSKGELSIKAGLLEEANSGTIYLHEISNLPLATQSKLFDFIQTKSMRRLNSKHKIDLKVRIIASTTTSLNQAVVSKAFDEQLFKKINRLSITIPALAERVDDLPLLIEYFIKKMNHKFGRKITGISNDTIEELKQYDWPGNIDELENVIRAAYIKIGHKKLQIERNDLAIFQQDKPFSDQKEDIVRDLQEVMDEFEKEYIKKVYSIHNFNKTKTAKALNISVRNLYYKLEKFKLD